MQNRVFRSTSILITLLLKKTQKCLKNGIELRVETSKA
jgi:hypothetical protein